MNGGLGLELNGFSSTERTEKRRAGEAVAQAAAAGLVEDGDVLGEVAGVVEVLAAGDALALEGDERGREAGVGGEGGVEVPVVGRVEGDALALALDDQADGRASAPGRRTGPALTLRHSTSETG